MKLKNLKEASYHGRDNVCVVSALDPDSGDHLGTVGPMTKAEAKKFVKMMEAYVKKEYAGRIKEFDLPIYDIDYLVRGETFRENVIEHCRHFAD